MFDLKFIFAIQKYIEYRKYKSCETVMWQKHVIPGYYDSVGFVGYVVSIQKYFYGNNCNIEYLYRNRDASNHIFKKMYDLV